MSLIYVLKNKDTGSFVAPAGGHKSYTTDLRRARRFSSFEEASREACGNETPIKYEEA